MSSKLMDRIWEHYPDGGGELLTALALAEHGDPDGTNIWPSVATVAAMTRQSERTVQYHMQRMLENGWLLMVHRGGGRRRPSKYRIPIDWIPADVKRGEKVQKLHPLIPEASENGCKNGASTPQQLLHPLGDKGCKNGATAVAPDQYRTSVPVRTARKRADTHAQILALPENFGVSDTVRKWAQAKGYEQLDLQLEVFVRKCRKHGYRYADWDLALMDAIEADWAGLREKSPPSKPAPDTSCREDIGDGEPCGLPGEPYGASFLCAHHREKRLEKREMPDAVRDRLNRITKRTATP